MKKIYALGVALAFGATAMAVPTDVVTVNQAQTMAKAQAKIEVPAKGDKQVKAPAKAISSVDDLYGLVSWTRVGILNSSDPEKGGETTFNTFLGPDEDNPGGLMMQVKDRWGVYMRMTVNLANKTLIIQNKKVAGENGTGGEAVYQHCYKVTDTGLQNVGSITCTLDDEGNIEMDPDYAVGFSDATASSGWYFLWDENEFSRIPFRTPTSTEGYTQLEGQATYTDGWFNPLYLAEGDSPIINTKVNVYVKDDEPTTYLIEKPYPYNEWISFGQSTEDTGYLLLDMSFEECVLCSVLVDCGMHPYDEDGISIAPDRFYTYNTVAMRVFQGEYIEDIIDEAAAFGEELSNYNPENHTITLKDLYFGVETAPLGAYWWSSPAAQAMQATTTSVIVLPEGAGVNGIEADNSNEVRYYNLQGLQIQNPVKGQLVIKKDGNKTVKYIAR